MTIVLRHATDAGTTVLRGALAIYVVDRRAVVAAPRADWRREMGFEDDDAEEQLCQMYLPP